MRWNQLGRIRGTKDQQEEIIQFHFDFQFSLTAEATELKGGPNKHGQDIQRHAGLMELWVITDIIKASLRRKPLHWPFN